MNERPELQPDDKALLARIDAALSGSHDQQAHDDLTALAAFAASAASTVPRADADFQGRLEARLLAAWERERGAATPPSERRRPERQPQRPTRGRRVFPRFVTWIAAGVLAALLLLVVSPGARLVTAAALDGIQRALQIVWGGPNGLGGLYPPPPFAVRQAGYLPPGFELYGDRYYANGVRGDLIRLDPATMLADPVIQEAVQRDRGDTPHLVLAYRSGAPAYAVLFQRAARPEEGLPPGAARVVGKMPATLQQSGQMRKLTWIDSGTWTELESTLAEAELLRVATGLVPLEQTLAGQITPPEPAWGDALRRMSGPIYCDPAEQPPRGPILGDASGQQYLGSFWVEMLNTQNGESEHTVTGLDVSGARAEVLGRALAVLRDPATPMQSLSYPVIITYTTSGPNGCLRPATYVQGYIVAEVWSGEVRLGYGGQGDALKERAIRALEREMQR